MSLVILKCKQAIALSGSARAVQLLDEMQRQTSFGAALETLGSTIYDAGADAVSEMLLEILKEAPSVKTN